MSWTVEYHERLNGETTEVVLPETRGEAMELFHEISALAETDPDKWKAAVRLWTSSDLYICGLFHSWWWRRDIYTGRAEVDCDFQFNYAREVQFEGDDTVDYTAREHGKSTWRHTRFTQEIVRDPNITIGIFSFDLKKGSEKHLVRWKTELENNDILKDAWDDVFFKNPKEQAPQWSIERGCNVKRTISSITPTISAWTFMKGLPTGARFSVMVFDDCETEETVTEEMLPKVKARFKSALNLGGRGCRKWIPGTFHHPDGLLADLIKKGWRTIHHPAEDVEQEPPDIAELYDRINGKRPDTGAPIPKEVRNVRLRGKPIYLHPLECAIKRFEQGHEVYEMQSMGDPLSGLTQKFKGEWISEETRIRADLREWSTGKNLYLLSDPSKGMGDPSVGLVVCADSDKTLTLVDGFRKKISPSQWEHEMYLLATRWERIGELQQIRVEVYGQSTWDHNLRSYFDQWNYYGAEIVPCAKYGRANEASKIMRIWTRLEPLFRKGKLRLPHRLMVEDEHGRPYDLVHHLVHEEYLPFPMASWDDVMDALSLLGEVDAGEIIYPSRRAPWQTDDEFEERPPVDPCFAEESWLWR